uniref:Uncharacterized protein n=1 Tax=Amphimedon queenslandica TaxID=400682 RepID=A0A1X7TEZ2_AMPQE
MEEIGTLSSPEMIDSPIKILSRFHPFLCKRKHKTGTKLYGLHRFCCCVNAASLFLPLTISSPRLLVSCLHAWNLDNSLDKECEDTLGFVRSSCPVSFGLLSKGGGLSLVLPAWGLVKESPSPVHNNGGVALDDV